MKHKLLNLLPKNIKQSRSLTDNCKLLIATLFYLRTEGDDNLITASNRQLSNLTDMAEDTILVIIRKLDVLNFVERITRKGKASQYIINDDAINSFKDETDDNLIIVGKYQVDKKVLFSDTPNEEFRIYPNDNRFLVSNMGRCFDMKNHRYVKDYNPSKGDYLLWYLCDYGAEDAHNHSIPIHQAVAATWLKKPDTAERLVIDHIDGVKHNNLASNLRYVTYRENATSQEVQARKVKSFKKTLEYKKQIKELEDKIKELEEKTNNTNNNNNMDLQKMIFSTKKKK